MSGNPGGRSKAAAEIARMIAAKTGNGAELVDLALGIVRGTCEERLLTAGSFAYAHNWLTERVAGKAPQVVTVADESERPVDLADLTDAQLEALAELDAVSSAPESPVLRLVPADPPPEPEPAA